MRESKGIDAGWRSAGVCGHMRVGGVDGREVRVWSLEIKGDFIGEARQDF